MVKVKTAFCVLFLLLWGVSGIGAGELTRERVPLTRNGKELFLERVKGENADAKKNLLLLHGMTYASHYFDLPYKDYSLMRFFSENGYNVWRLDIAGFGQSDKVEDGFQPDSDYAAEDIHAAARKICETTGTAKIDLLGWSWGTVTAARFAGKHPELLNKLVLYAPVVTGIADAPREVNKPFIHDAWGRAYKDFRKDENGKLDENFAEPGLVACYQESCRTHDKEDIPNASRREVFSGKDTVLIEMDKIPVPVLVVYGTRDQYMNLPLIRDAFPRLPLGSELAVINGASHIAFLEHPFYRVFRSRVLSFLVSGNSAETANAEASAANPLGIIGAMPEEVEKLKTLMTAVKIVRHAGMDFYRGQLCGKDVVVVTSGIGKVNAAAAAQAMVARFKVGGIINTGVAGSLDNRISIGDIVVSTDAVEHDFDLGALGFPPGQIPGIGGLAFVADSRLRRLAKEAGAAANTDMKVWDGRVVSGDQYIADKEKKEWLAKTFSGMCAEMEGAAIAHVAHLNHVPFVIIRSISDKADNSSMMNYNEFKEMAVGRSVKLVLEMVKRM